MFKGQAPALTDAVNNLTAESGLIIFCCNYIV